MRNTDTTLTKKQIMLSRLIIGLVFVLLGIFLLSAGGGAFDLDFIKCILPSSLFAIGIIFFILAFIQKNSLSLWLAFPFLIGAIITTLTYITSYGYAQLYPLYIMIPAVSSLITAIYTKEYKAHLKVTIPFAMLSVLFLLNSLFCVSWKILLPAFVILLGVAAIIYGLKNK